MDVDNSPVHATYMAKKKVKSRLKRERQPNYIRAWRKRRRLSLEQLADRIGTSHASLSRVERGKQPWNQNLLDALADALETDWQSLLMRDPSDPEGIWTIWEHAKPSQRQAIVEHAQIILKTGTDG